MITLAPGVYDDECGGLHLVLPEILAALGFADTPENQAMLVEAAHSLFANRASRSPTIVIVDDQP